jgi:ribosome maturation protein Sdo1
MSEAIGFMLALKYHFNGGNSKYPPHFAHNHVTSALEEVGLTTNLYEVTDQQIQDAIDHLKEAFPAGEIK